MQSHQLICRIAVSYFHQGTMLVALNCDSDMFVSYPAVGHLPGLLYCPHHHVSFRSLLFFVCLYVEYVEQLPF